jgi:hypothetical protein
MSVPATRTGSALGDRRSVEVATLKDARRPQTQRLLAFGALTVSVVEDLNTAGYPPARLTVTVGGKPVQTLACGFDVGTGRRWIDTELGLVVVPSAQDRTQGACLTVNGMAIPGA